jgi:hypothetical protein
MVADRASLTTWRARVAALTAPACAMAHESIPLGPDGAPARSAASPSGYARAGICPAAVRAAHVGCSHTTARHVLRDALDALNRGGLGGDGPLRDELRDIENNISLLDHRRYDAETCHARALEAATPDSTTQRAIDDLVAEHRRYAARALALRDAVLARLDAALAGMR